MVNAETLIYRHCCDDSMNPRRDYGPEFDPAKVARGMEEQARKARQLTRDFIGFVRVRIWWLVERITAFRPEADEIIQFQLAWMRYLLRAEAIAGWSEDDKRPDAEFDATWQAELEARNKLIEQVKLLANLPHPPRARRGDHLMRRRQAARIARSRQSSLPG